MDLLVGHVKWLGTSETQGSYSMRPFVEASTGEQAVERIWKAWGMVRWAGRSPVTIISTIITKSNRGRCLP